MMRFNLAAGLCSAIASTAAALWGISAVAQTTGTVAAAPQPQLPQVIVIGNTPLEGFGLPLNQIPSNVQMATAADLQRQQSLDVVDYLNNNFSGISVSESDGNPFQIDVYYHGFTASPLLGTPEGLSVYVDGVRVNESFGDTVNWDLIPEYAINSVSLISGSNPVFGLNTLGGALSVKTKNGRTDPGTERVLMHAEDQHARLGFVRQHAPHGLDTAGPGQCDIHDDDLRVQTTEQRVGRGGVGRLADHGDITVPLEQAPVAFAYHRMIIHEQYAELVLVASGHCVSPIVDR
jgi:hypothetical protein